MRAEIGVYDDSNDHSITLSNDESVRVYRKQDSHLNEVLAKKEGDIFDLETRGAGVSREFNNDGEPTYIEFYIQDNQLHVRDTGSRNETTIQSVLHGELEVEVGETYTLTGDTQIKIGPTTILTVSVTREKQGQEAIAVQADLVYKISDKNPVNKVENEVNQLMSMLKDDDSKKGSHQYDNCIDDLKAAYTMLEMETEKNPSEPLEEHKEIQRKVANVADKIRKMY